MKRIIFYFLIILGSVWLGLKIYQQPGYILIFYRHFAIETTTWFVILILLAAFTLLYFLISLLRETAHLPERVERWWQNHKLDRAMQALNKGYLNLLCGNWRVAEKNLLKSAKCQSLSFTSNMLAAQAAEERHAIEKRDNYLTTAQQHSKKTPYIGIARKAQFQLKANQPELALSNLLPLREVAYKNPYLLRLLAESYIQLRDWISLQVLLSDLKKHDVFEENEYHAIEKETYLCALKSHFSNFSDVQILWNKVPRRLRHDSDILIAYAIQLTRWNRNDVAEELVRKELKKNFEGQLMQYYVTTSSKEPSKQLALGEKYLKENGQDPASLRAMGILCLRNRLWGQARDYLEKSLRLEPMPQAYASLGYVYEKLGDSEKALSFYRKGLKNLINHDYSH